MKKVLILAGISLGFTACASGINHNVVTVDGKPYLVETRNRNVFGIAQWSEIPTYINIEEDVKRQDQVNRCVEQIRIDKPNISDNEFISKQKKCEKLFKPVTNKRY
ncbi:MAG: hypothetical protein PUB86_07105 [Elusimicrobia bacterium]|nr:hypothetical protein [Elusimicrobiota bacterium]